MQSRSLFAALRRLAIAPFLIAALVVTSSAVAVDLPKKGAFKGMFGYFAVVKTYEIEKGHLVIVGEWSGTSFNEAGSGIFHGAGTMCPGLVDLLPSGEHKGHGYCTFTDATGDKVYSTWECEGKVPCKGGTATFTGGTGKFTGLKGNFSWDNSGMAVPTPSGASGYNNFRGTFELP